MGKGALVLFIEKMSEVAPTTIGLLEDSFKWAHPFSFLPSGTVTVYHGGILGHMASVRMKPQVKDSGGKTNSTGQPWVSSDRKVAIPTLDCLPESCFSTQEQKINTSISFTAFSFAIPSFVAKPNPLLHFPCKSWNLLEARIVSVHFRLDQSTAHSTHKTKSSINLSEMKETNSSNLDN